MSCSTEGNQILKVRDLPEYRHVTPLSNLSLNDLLLFGGMLKNLQVVLTQRKHSQYLGLDEPEVTPVEIPPLLPP